MSQIILAENAVAPGTPSTGKSIIYPKTDGLWYSKDDAGVESPMSGPAGSNTQVQFNDSGALAGDADFTYNKTTNALVVGGSLSVPAIVTASGALTITPAAGSGLNIALSTTGDFAVNTDDLYVDTSTGNVGIGTTAPNQILELKSNNPGLAWNEADAGADGKFYDIIASGGLFSFRLVNDAYSAATDWLVVQRSGITVTDVSFPNGNVGIGTTAPTSPLQVVGLPTYANNAAAVTGGLTAGAFYRNNADPDLVCVVH